MADDSWLSVLVGAARWMDAVPSALAIIDPESWAVAYANPAMADLIGRAVPDTLAELDALGLVSRADRYELVAVGSTAGVGDSCSVVQARVARAHGPAVPITVHVARLHAVRGLGAALVVTAWETSTEMSSTASAVWPARLLCDLDGVVVAADDPDGGQVGSHPLITVHPVDAALVAPIIRAMAAGAVFEAHCVVRARDRVGGWTNVQVDVCRLDGPAPLLLVTVTPQEQQLEVIEHGCLTNGELEVARALFAGRRPAHIAERREVSIRTVRNQITSLYEKLGVRNVRDLTSRYSLPLRPAPPRLRVARSPRLRQ
jgi:DNA-binding CsgD family transcriptional regulator